MLLDIKNVFGKTAPGYLRALGGLAAGLIGGSVPLMMDGPSLWSQKMLVATGMLGGGILILLVSMHLGVKAQKK